MTMTTEIKERPITFSGELVRAIIQGRKTQTRQIVKPQPSGEHVTFMPLSTELVGVTKHGGEVDRRGWLTCPFGLPGDRLWVRETWQTWTEFDHLPVRLIPNEAMERINFLANGCKWDAKVRSPLHLPRWASRITLEVTEVRVDPLDDISQTDAMKEGTQGRRSFAILWDELHGRGAFGKNPWVWVISFKRIDLGN